MQESFNRIMEPLKSTNPTNEVDQVYQSDGEFIADFQIFDGSQDFNLGSTIFCETSAEIPASISDLCRMCGHSAVQGIDIFGERGLAFELKEKIALHTPITPEDEDEMPRKVCCDCCDKLEATHQMVVACLQLDFEFRRCLNISEKPNYDPKYFDLARASTLNLANDANFRKISDRNHHDYCKSPRRIEETVSEEKIVGESRENPETAEFVETPSIRHVAESNGDHTTDGKYVVQSDFNKLIEVVEVVVPKNEKKSDETSTGIEENPTIQENEIPAENSKKTRKRKFANKTDDVAISIKVEAPVLTSKRRCGYCSFSFKIRKELQIHVAADHPDQELLYKCGICENAYTCWRSLDVHEATHKKDTPYLCDLCGKSFKHSNNLRGHKRTHLEDSKKKRHVCDLCGRAFRSGFHLREHMNFHNGNKPYPCEKCGKAFSMRIQLRQHRLTHSSNKHVCPICGVTFNRRGNMSQHMKKHDTTKGTYACSVCKSRYESISELRKHRKSHTESEITTSILAKSSDNKVWKCKICGKIFAKRCLMMTHEETHQIDRKSYECEKCGKQLSTKSSLKYHEKSRHTNERKHVCKFCDASFVSKDLCVVHERIHTGERPFVCEICNMKYRSSSNLSQHMKTHSSLNLHVCKYCQKSFTRKNTLSAHERTHRLVKSFNCEMCARSFTQKSDMIKHAKIHLTKPTTSDGKNDDTNFELKRRKSRRLVDR